MRNQTNVFGFIELFERDVVVVSVVDVLFQILLFNFANPKKHKATNEKTTRPITVKTVNTVVGL